MRKKLVYSLATLGVVPMAVNALPVDVSTIDLIQSKWAGTGLNYDNQGAIIVNPSGEPITQQVGKLAKGSYVFKYDFKETDGSDIVIEVGGVTKTVSASEIGTGEVEFTLEGETIVEVKISSVNTKSFMIGDASVELRFDFEAAAEYLKKKSDDQLYVIQMYQNPNRNSYDMTEGGAVDQLIQEILDNQNYETYANMELWDLDNTEIAKKIIESAKKAAADEDDYEGKLAEALLEKLQASQGEIDNLSEYSKDALQSIADEIKKDIESYKENVQKAKENEEYPAYDLNKVTNKDYLAKEKALDTRIDDLNDAIETAKNANSANDAAYNAVKAALKDAQNDYNQKRNELEELYSDFNYDKDFADTEEAGKYNRYKTLLKSAISELDAQALILGTTTKNNEASHTAGTSVADKPDFIAAIEAANAEINNISNNYYRRYLGLSLSLQNKVQWQAKYDKQLAKYSDVVKGLDKNPTNIQKVQDLINTIIDKIDHAVLPESGNEFISWEDLPLKDWTEFDNLNLVDDFEAIETAFEEMKAIADKDQKNYTQWKTQDAQYKLLESLFNSGKATAEKYTYDSYFGNRNPYAKYKNLYETTLQNQLNDIKNAIQRYYNNYFTQTKGNPYRSSGPVDNNSNLQTSIGNAQTGINNANKSIKESTEWYNHLAEAVSGYQKDLDDFTALVKDLEIYKQTVTFKNTTAPDPNLPVEGATYEEKIANVQAKIDAITNDVNSVWNGKSKGIEYGNGIKDINDGVDNTGKCEIDDDIAALNNSYEADQTLFDQLQANIVVTEMHSIVIDLINDINARLSNLTNGKDIDPFKESIENDRNVLSNQMFWPILNEAFPYYTEPDGTNAIAQNAKKSLEDLLDDVNAISLLTKTTERLKLIISNPDEELDLEQLEQRVADAEANYVANAALTNLWDEVKAAYDQAVRDAATEDPDAGTKYWKNDVLKKKYLKLLNQYKDELNIIYYACQSVDKQEGYEGLLKDLKKEIEAVKALVIANVDSYQGNADKKIKGLLAYEGDVQAKFDEVSFNIAAMDESTMRDDYQAELTEKKNTLIRYIAAIEEDYNKGLANENRQEWINKLGQLIADINDIWNRQQEGYNAQIKEDNDNTWKAIMGELDNTQNIFNDAVAELKMYKEMECEVLQGTLDKVQNDAVALETLLAEYPTTIDNLQKKAYDEYTSTESPTVFDKQKGYQAQVKAIGEDLQQKIDNFVEQIKQHIANDVQATIDDYESRITTAKYTIKDYSSNAKKNAFKDVEEYIAMAKDYMVEPNLKDLDGVLKTLQDIDAMLKTDMNNAANKDLGGWIETLKDEVENGRAYIERIDNENPNKQEWLDKFEEEIAQFVEGDDNAIDLYDTNKPVENLPAVYNDIKEKYNSFHNNNQYSKLKNSEAKYNAEIAALNTAQSLLNDAIAYVEQFEISGKEKDEILNGLQEDINERRAKAEEAFKNGNASSLTADISAISGIINYLRVSKVYEDEGAQLLHDLQDLEQEFNRFANDVVTNPALHDIVQGYKAQIDAWKAELDPNNTQGVYYKNKPTKSTDTGRTEQYLLPYEAKIAALLAEINLANDADNAARLVAGLNDQVSELEAKANTLQGDEYDQEVRDTYQADIDRQKAEIEKVKAIVSDNATTIIFYKDKAQQEIDAINAELDKILGKANADQEVLNAKKAANELAYNTLNEELDLMVADVDASKTKVNEYTNVKSSDFNNQYGLVLEHIAQEKAEINELYKGIELTAASAVSDELKKDVANRISDIENTAAYREIDIFVKKMRKQANLIVINEADYTIDKYEELKKELESIQNGIDDLEWDNSQAKAKKSCDADFETNKETVDKLQERINALVANVNNEVASTEVAGDITGTGDVTMDDFDKFLEDLLQDNLPADPTDSGFTNYDANGDYKVNIGDLQAILNMVNGLNADGTDPDGAAGARSMDNVFDAGSLSVQSQQMENGVTRLMINLNSTADYRAFQMDVTLAEGMRVVAENGTNLTVRSNDLTATKHRIAGYGRMTSGTVLTIDFEGQGDITFGNVVFSTMDAKAVSFELGNVTGISTVNVAEQSGNVFYDLGGKMMKGLKKGLSIIRGTDGTTRKVVK